jgi:hypothetical protein
VLEAMKTVGTHLKLGCFEPYKVAVYDDDMHGDQKARYAAFSYSATY